MKKRFTEQQIVAILKEGEVEASAGGFDTGQ